MLSSPNDFTTNDFVDVVIFTPHQRVVLTHTIMQIKKMDDKWIKILITWIRGSSSSRITVNFVSNKYIEREQ